MKITLEEGDIIQITKCEKPAAEELFVKGGYHFKNGVPYYTDYTCSIIAKDERSTQPRIMIEDVNAVQFLSCVFNVNGDVAYDLASLAVSEKVSEFSGDVRDIIVKQNKNGELGLEINGKLFSTAQEAAREYEKGSAPVRVR